MNRHCRSVLLLLSTVPAVALMWGPAIAQEKSELKPRSWEKAERERMRELQASGACEARPAPSLATSR